MFGKSTQSRSPEPSFYYVMLAAIRRTALSHNPYAGGALRNIGREYLVKAGCGVALEQVSERSFTQSSRTGAENARRLPC